MSWQVIVVPVNTCLPTLFPTCSLSGSVLKGTVLANMNHGPWLSGKTFQAKQEIGKLLSDTITDEWVTNHLDDITFDHGVAELDPQDVDPTQVLAQFIDARTLSVRGIYVLGLVTPSCVFLPSMHVMSAAGNSS